MLADLFIIVTNILQIPAVIGKKLANIAGK
jgi:hypothetical protein